MLTDEMTRLCGEILTMRGMRGNMMGELRRDAASRKKVMAEFSVHLNKTRSEMARKTKKERLAFFSQLKRTVGAQRRETRSDLAGARRAWAGSGS
jgi:hypothetical protein